MRKATKSETEHALLQLSKYIPRKLILEFEDRKCRIIEPGERGTYSVPFGYTWYSYDDMYHTIWFAIEALNMAGVRRNRHAQQT